MTPHNSVSINSLGGTYTPAHTHTHTCTHTQTHKTTSGTYAILRNQVSSRCSSDLKTHC